MFRGFLTSIENMLQIHSQGSSIQNILQTAQQINNSMVQHINKHQMNTLKVLRSVAFLYLSIVLILIHKSPTQLEFPHLPNINLLQAKPNVEGILIHISQLSKAPQGAVPPPPI